MTKLTDFINPAVAGVDLAAVPTVSQVTITNTGGTDAIILDATTARAGVMTKTQVDKLAGIAPNANNYSHPTKTTRTANIDTGPLTGAVVISDLDMNVYSDSLGHVTSASFAVNTRVLTLIDLGFTGDPDANEYIHPGFTARSLSFTGSKVLAAFTSNAEGHVTGVTTRDMTPSDIGAAPAADVPEYNAGTFTPTLIGATGGSISGTVVWVTLGNLVMITGQVKWTTAPSGTSQVRIGGFPYTNDFETGFGYSGSNVENQAGAANGMFLTMYAGATDVRCWGYNENGVRALTDYNDVNSNGTINLNFSYYSSQVPTQN